MAVLTCTCMTEDPGDGFGERVVIHSLSCPEHPDYNPGYCAGCGTTFHGERGLRAHQTRRFAAMGCLPVRRP